MSDVPAPDGALAAAADDEDRRTVTALLAQHGLAPSPAEVDRLVAGYRGSRVMTGLLHAAPGVRYDEPAVTYDPRP
jgi:hypothetical protein